MNNMTDKAKMQQKINSIETVISRLTRAIDALNKSKRVHEAAA